MKKSFYLKKLPLFDLRINKGDSNLMIGLDIGAGMTKGVLMDDSSIIESFSTLTSDPVASALKVLKALLGNKQGMKLVISASGGGSRKIGKKLLNLPVIRVDEIQAIGIGGLTLAGKSKGLIINVGTGTAIVVAYNNGGRVIHVGGTGVGGGTILGLSSRMLGIDRFEEAEKLAERGDAGNVDLTVRDIVGEPIGIIPADATASNFGKLHTLASKKDVAAGIFNMVCQVVGVVGAMAAKAHGLEEHVIITGGLVKSKLASKIISDTMKLFSVRPLIPENCEYCTAVGAARTIQLKNKI